MTAEQRTAIADYIGRIEKEWRSGQATEHTYRPMLKTLVETLLPRVTAVNEPKHIACGAPDYLIRRRTDILGFIEAKDLGDGDLDGRGAHKEQFDRYKESLDTLCFTDYLDFHFYDRGDFVDSVRIAELKGDRLALADDAALDRFVQLVLRFAEQRPQHIASPARLAQLMAGKARLLAAGVRQYLGREENAGSMLAQQMEAFRRVLIHDIDADSFADIFAQTVTYGMFAARLHDETPEDFSRAEAATLIPKTNPLLRQMFQYIAMDTDDSIEWIIDDLVSLFAAVDVEKLMRSYGKDTQKTDPLLHFYEDFLAAYDPRLRKVRGVWNTPTPVVGFIVRAVDRILERDFALPGGLADPSKTKVKVVNDAKAKRSDKSFVEREVHRVQMLDPAAGTGTFLAETVKLIHAKVARAMGEGAWQGYVADNLLPRLNGFEILMASYAMAHLKLDMLLAETGYEHRTNERLRVFLTNSLEPYDKEIGTLFAAALSREANEANFVKRDCPVMVVMGNPPYSVSSANKGEWIQGKIADYKKGLGEKKLNLDDDYIKFLRLGQYYVEKNGEGVLAFISNNSFVDGITHRQMRKSLLESFDEIYILNLHGNARKKEMTPDGSKDENVFDIMQGVSINIFVKRNTVPDASRVAGAGKGPLATVHYADLYGVRESKYAFLDANTLESVKWQTLALQEPYYFFVPKDFGLQEEYEKGFKIDELMPVCNTAVKTDRDSLFVDTDRKRESEKIRVLLSGDIPSRFADEYRVVNSGSYKIRDRIVGKTFDEAYLRPILYRPFDVQWIYYDPGIVSRPGFVAMRHMLQDNLSLIVDRMSPVGVAPVFVSDGLAAHRSWTCSGMDGMETVFPLYLYETSEANLMQEKGERHPNFDAAIYAKICAAVNDAPCLQASANTYYPRRQPSREAGAMRCVRNDDRLVFYRKHELGKTWYDVADPRELLSMEPIVVESVDPNADRHTAKEVFRKMPPVRNEADGRVVRFTVRAAKKLIFHKEISVFGFCASFDRLFAGSIHAWSETAADIPDHRLHPNIDAYHHYIAKAAVGGEMFYVRFTVREDVRARDGNEFHGTMVTRVVVYSAKDASLSNTWKTQGETLAPQKATGTGRSFRSHTHGESPVPFVDNKIALFLSAVNGVGPVTAPRSEDAAGTVTPEDVFNYIYGVLHTPSYREKYREFLKIDFPRIPYPKNAAEFRRIAAIGEKLVRVHLLKDAEVTNPFSNPYAKFAGAGDGKVTEVKVEGEGEQRKVYISKSQWFEPMPEEAWNFSIGGYQPAQKWLKDRKGRTLSTDDQQHYRAIVAALMKTAALMQELSGQGVV